MSDDIYNSAQEFLWKLDSGLLDGMLAREVQRLSPAQLKEVTETLLQRVSSNITTAKQQERLLDLRAPLTLMAKSDSQDSVFMVGLERDPTAWAIEDNLEAAIESWIVSEVKRYEHRLRQHLWVAKPYNHDSTITPVIHQSYPSRKRSGVPNRGSELSRNDARTKSDRA
jgi:hypothetical protein